jgi:hypothetical protein
VSKTGIWLGGGRLVHVGWTAVAAAAAVATALSVWMPASQAALLGGVAAVSFGLHEAGHLAAARVLGLPLARLGTPATPTTVGFLADHSQWPPTRAGMVALAGPASGSLFCLLFLVAGTADRAYSPTYVVAVAVVAVLHIANLLPFRTNGGRPSDGQVVATAISKNGS